ncbi:hypothetical protein FRC17_007725 [Serendipita sp. 399]|nr:hypothetical protein FRC17_007725 [Serendipita sp. 399]
MSSSVTCGYADASWEINSANQDACEQYAHLIGLCDSSFTVQSVTPSSDPYTPPLNRCGCNLLAYNLQAACGWCQNDIQATWWLTLDQWQGNCTAGGQSYLNGAPTAVTGYASLTVPAWATITPRLSRWSPSQASAIAVAAASASVPAPASGIGNTIVGAGYSFLNGVRSTSVPRGRPTSNNNNSGVLTDEVVHNAWRGAIIALAIFAAIYALAGIILGLVYFTRQKRRKAWYAEAARYQRSLRMGQYPYPPAGGNNYEYPPSNAPGGVYQPPHAPLLYNNEPNVPGSPGHSGHIPLPSSSSPAPSSSYGYHPQQQTGYPPPQQPYSNTNPFITPNSSTVGLEYAQGGLGYQTQAQSYPTYAPPPGGPPAQGAPGFKGHAEVY